MVLFDTLSDAKAVEILSTVVKGQRLAEAAPAVSVADVQSALNKTFGTPGQGKAPTTGDMARQALRVLSLDPDTKAAIEALAQGPVPEAFGLAANMTAAVVVTLCLAVLSTHVRYEKDKDGQASFLIEKNALSDATLKAFMEMFQRLGPPH